MKKFQIARGYECEQIVFFQDRLLHSYLDEEELTCGSVGSTFRSTLHPFFSLFSYYDYRMSRFDRFTFVLGQVSLITLLVFLCFSKTGLEWFGEDHSTRKMLYMAGALSILLIPLPRSWLKCM